MKQKDTPFPVKTILQSLNDDLKDKKITINDAAITLYQSGWTTSIDIEKSKELLDKWKRN